MTAECQDCRNRFYVEGDGTESVACPDCSGQLIPERDQPGGTNSDGELRNMVDPYTQKDMGGDPNQDGIWASTDGGWKPPSKRDESFASVKTAAHHIENVEPGPWGIHNGPLALLSDLGSVQINGEHVNRESHGGMFQRWGFRDQPEFRAPVTVSAHHPAFAELAAKVIRDGHGNRAAYKDDVMQLHQGIKDGLIPKPVDENGQPRLAHINPINFRNSHLQPLDQTIYGPWGTKLALDITPWDGALPGSWHDDQGFKFPWTVTEGQQDQMANDLDKGGISSAKSMAELAALGTGGAAAGELSAGAAGVRAAPGAAAKAAGGTGVAAKALIKNVVKKAPGAFWKSQMLNAMQGAGGTTAPAPPVQAPTLQQVSHIYAFDTTPTSLDKIPESDDTGDTQEFKDQSDSLNPDNPGNDESLGANLSPETEAFADSILPKLIEFYNSEHSGADDPDVQHLIHLLKQEGIDIDDHDDEKQNDDPLADGNVDDTDDIKSTAALGAPVPGNATVPGIPPALVGPNPQQSRCQVCGGTLNPDGTCAQCGFNPANAQQMNRALTPGVTASKTADTQGPANPEQFRAVSEVLIQQGRAEEIPHMFEAPWEYADILAQVQNDQTPPPPAVANPAQPPMDPNAMMPPGGDPSQMPPGAAPGGPPAPGGMPPGLASIASAVSRFSADNIAPRCPECGSHTTGVLSTEGHCHCHACKHQWQEGIEHGWLRHADLDSTHEIDEAPAKDHDAIEDHQEPQEASQTWETTDGSPLEIGQEYELHSSKYPVPDIVKIVDIKPNELILATTGEFEDLDDQISITKQEALNEDYSFVPSAGQDPQAGNEDADEYLNDEVNKGRANTNPTPASAVPYTSRTAAPLYPYDGPQLNDRSHEQAGHFSEAEKIFHEQGWDAAKAFLEERLKGHEQKYYGDDGVADVGVSEFGQHMHEQGHDAPSMWHDRGMDQGLGGGEESTGPSTNWTPGQGGRGVFLNGQLHTWPVNKTPENPQGGLMHGEYIQQHAPGSQMGGAFEIDHDGSVVDLGQPLSDEEKAQLAHHHPETHYNEGGDDLFNFSKTRGNPRTKRASDPGSIDQTAYQSIIDNGGVTIGLNGTQPTSGFAFSPYKHWEMRIPQDQFTPAHVTQYITQHQEALREPNNYLGAWVAGNEVWLDVSQVLPDQNQAMQAAQAAGQEAIFDLSTFQEIPVGRAHGTGPTEPVTATSSNEGLDWLREGIGMSSTAPWEKPLPDLTGSDIFDPSRGEVSPHSGSNSPRLGEDTGPDWLLDGVSASRLAGKRFSPNEQKKFIDEEGNARNLDKLDLEGTHYRTKDSSSVHVPGRGERMSDPWSVPDDHLVFGL